MTQSVNTKRIVCLANSRKRGGRCIAGKEILEDGRPGGWVRPVSDRENEGVKECERQYGDGSEPRVLDVVDVPVLRPMPQDYQHENWQLNPKRRWVKVGCVDRNVLSQCVDTDETLWTNGYSTINGLNDQIPLLAAKSLKSSLRLIRVDRMKLSVFQPGKNFGDYRRRVQGRFRYRGTDYWLWVTDSNYEGQYLQRPNGSYPIGGCFLTVSLGGSHRDNNSYKLVAAIIRP